MTRGEIRAYKAGWMRGVRSAKNLLGPKASPLAQQVMANEAGRQAQSYAKNRRYRKVMKKCPDMIGNGLWKALA